jgi:hypothetical protein
MAWPVPDCKAITACGPEEGGAVMDDRPNASNQTDPTAHRVPAQMKTPARGQMTVQPRIITLVGTSSSIEVRRILPGNPIRTVGPWCFVDHFGPTGSAMDVGPHPHCGIQTVSWLLSGTITHRDSAGHKALVRPGDLSLMTAGHGIAHSEYSRYSREPTPDLAGVQLWVALPDAVRDTQAHYEHHTALPSWEQEGLVLHLLMGELAGAISPAITYSPIVGAAIGLSGDSHALLPLEPDLEYAVLAAAGSATVAGAEISMGRMRYLGWGNREVLLESRNGAQLMLLGGEPITTPLLMWWNFVARSHEEIVAARQDWMGGDRFGVVADDPGVVIPAPELPNVRLKPRS